MKYQIIAALILFFAQNSGAQNNTFPTTGNVGIGTTSPISKLHVLDNNRNYYVNRAISGQTEDTQGINYLLLHEIYTGTLSPERYVMGKITGIRGSTVGSSRKWTVEVNISAAYNNNKGSIISYNEPAKLVTLVYSGKSYLAVEIMNSSTLSFFSFTGYAANELLQLAKDNDVTAVQVFTPTDAIGIQGNVSIGSAGSNARLDVSGGPLWLTNNWTKSMRIYNRSAVEFMGESKTFGMGAAGTTFYFFHANVDGTGPSNFYMTADGTTGNISMGNTLPAANYKLVVEGAISARRIKIQQSGWADYVFHDSYKLPDLFTVESFIRQHKHLPDIPSAAEVDREGIDLGEMNKKLLQKIEELTLYIIDIKKEALKQQSRMDNFERIIQQQ